MKFPIYLSIIFLIYGLMGCSITKKPPVADGLENVTCVIVEPVGLRVWSRLAIEEIIGSVKPGRVFEVVGDAKIKYQSGPEITVSNNMILFNGSNVDLTAKSMVVTTTNYIMGAFIRTFE